MPKVVPALSSSFRRRRISKEQQYEELCAALLLTAKEAGRDASSELDVGDWEQRNTRAKRLWELSNSLMLSALVARISLQIKEGEVGAIGTAPTGTLGYYVAAWRSRPYTLHQEVKGVAGMLEAGTLVADAVLYNPVRFAPGWYTLSTSIDVVVVEVAQVLLTGLPLMTIRDSLSMKTKRNPKKKRQQQTAKVPLSLHEAITEAALQRDRLVYDKSESESGDEDSGPELSESEDED